MVWPFPKTTLRDEQAGFLSPFALLLIANADLNSNEFTESTSEWHTEAFSSFRQRLMRVWMSWLAIPKALVMQCRHPF